MTWTEKIQKHILNIEHRHVLFTIPQECRKFFFYDRSLLLKLSAAVNQVFKFIFHNISRKRKRKNKISEHSRYYFTDSDIVHYGLISVIHTFGRDLKWNPHVHAIVSLGGFNKNLEFRKMRYFNVDTIAGQWKYHVLKIIENGSYPNRKIEKDARNTATKLYKENRRFFFNVGNGDINSTKGIIKYLGRYLARAPIAEYKITDITMPSVRFVSHILIHLLPKNFKMVNRYGFYSRHISDRLKETIDAFRKKIAVSRYSFYQRQMYKTFRMNPFYCPACKVKMIVWEFYHYRYPPLKKYY